jgi:hypothetical protein
VPVGHGPFYRSARNPQGGSNSSLIDGDPSRYMSRQSICTAGAIPITDAAADLAR